jgi:reversibly glycosylated polypeptide/UDP-arabinopyranose mutase
MKIGVVVPTIREEKLNEFLVAWDSLFKKHKVNLYIVRDGKNPTVNGESIKSVIGKYSSLIYNFNDGVRNLGFAKAYKDGMEIIISLDDDVLPCGDTIQDHLDILGTQQPITYMNSVDDVYMRGFPYWARNEATVMFSHGVWNGVYDFDASTQLVLGTPHLRHRKMPVPKGVLMPVCVMNVAFRREILPYYYQAPMFGDINRFADIWSGWEVKKAIDDLNMCMVTGYAKVNHNRASNPFVNLIKEARGVGMNEDYGKDEYFKLYQKNIKLWKKYLSE